MNTLSGLVPPTPPQPAYISSGISSSCLFPISQTDQNSNARTRGPFKPRNSTKGTSSYQLRQFAEATLGSGSLRKAVKLPEGEDLNEWLAVNGGCSTFVDAIRRLIMFVASCRFLQSDQPFVWINHRILLAAFLPRDESYR